MIYTDITSSLKQCIQTCLECHRLCQQFAERYCVTSNGLLSEPSHIRQLRFCAGVCQTTVQTMISRADVNYLTCHLCAQSCCRCADACQPIEGMEDCVQACLVCAESCDKHASLALAV